MTEEEIKSQIRIGLEELYKQEFSLIQVRAEEETIVTHLIHYLKEGFKLWSVDSEYNRDGKDTKLNSNGRKIFPDIVIHHRTPNRENRFSPENNLVAIEAKGYWNPQNRELDEAKLIDMKKHYGYQYLFRIEFNSKGADLIPVASN